MLVVHNDTTGMTYNIHRPAIVVIDQDGAVWRMNGDGIIDVKLGYVDQGVRFEMYQVVAS